MHPTQSLCDFIPPNSTIYSKNRTKQNKTNKNPTYPSLYIVRYPQSYKSLFVQGGHNQLQSVFSDWRQQFEGAQLWQLSGPLPMEDTVPKWFEMLGCETKHRCVTSPSCQPRILDNSGVLSIPVLRLVKWLGC